MSRPVRCRRGSRHSAEEFSAIKTRFYNYLCKLTFVHLIQVQWRRIQFFYAASQLRASRLADHSNSFHDPARDGTLTRVEAHEHDFTFPLLLALCCPRAF